MYIPAWVFWIGAGIGIFIYFRNRKNKKIEFVPFRINIRPNWYALLKDYGLIDDQGWNELIAPIITKRGEYNLLHNGIRGEYNVLRNGISFTVLQADENSDLIYNDNWNTFHANVDFRERVEEIKFKNDYGMSDYSPEFCVKWHTYGYKLCITTPESFKKVHMVGDDMDLIEITTLPYCLFYMSKYKYGVLKEDQVNFLLKKYGWERGERMDPDDDAAGFPYKVEHKYFTVYYKEI